MSLHRSGFSLLELLTVVVVIGLLAASAVPRMVTLVDGIRARGALDRVVGELYRARMLGVEVGRPVTLVLGKSAAGCVERVRIQVDRGPGYRSATSHLESGTLCVRHSGDSVLTFNGRGMLRPPARSIYIRSGSVADSVLVSIAGRIRRSY